MAKPEDIKKIIKELNEEVIFIKGFDKALYGTGRVIGGKTVAVYNADDCLEVLIDEHEMGEMEAWEHFNGIVVDGASNPNKPIFVSDWRGAVDVSEVLKGILIDKNQALSDIVDQVIKKKEDEETENDDEEKSE